MEKLTLEHISPYLPYGLKAVKVNHFEILVKGAYISNYDILYFISASDSNFVANDCKIYLRPIDLTKLIQVNGKEVIPIVELCKMCYKEIYYPNDFDENNLDELEICIIGICSSIETISLDIAKWLYAHKYDVDGLIEKGLAIDVNTLETNPYN